MERYERPFRFRHNKIPYLIQGGALINRFLGQEQDTQLASQLWIGSTVQSMLPDAPDSRSWLEQADGGECFADLLQAQPEQYLGKAHVNAYGSSTGILLKLLHSDYRLLVQTHPDKQRALQYFHSPFGKTEAWHVLDTTEDQPAYIYAGFRPHVTRELFASLIQKQDTQGILDCLHRFEVHKGDTIFIPAGLPHALGANSLVAELQEPTDITLRAERIRGDGTVLSEESMHSGIGMDGLLDCFAFQCRSEAETRQAVFVPPADSTMQAGGNETVLIGSDTTDCFGMKLVHCTAQLHKTNTAFALCLVLEGEGYLQSGECRIPLSKGTECFIPNGVKHYAYQTNTSIKILECYPPR